MPRSTYRISKNVSEWVYIINIVGTFRQASKVPPVNISHTR
jgi:hypothetical protein